MKLILVFAVLIKFLPSSFLKCAPALNSQNGTGLVGVTNGSRILRTYPAKDQLDRLRSIQEDYDFWSSPIECGPTDIYVDPVKLGQLREFLKSHKIQFDTKDVPEIQSFYEEEMKPHLRTPGGFNWKQYHNLETIYQWLDLMAGKYKNLMRLQVIGKSLENRPLKLVKIGIPSKNGRKPSMWIDGGTHAREWASPSTACYIINELVTKKSQNLNILTQVDIYILPIVNPDGYVYSRVKDRLWRKNRRKNKGKCQGVDLNRNFGVNFGGKGSSGDSCSEFYRGPNAFSEPETRAIKNFISSHKIPWRIYIALHTYGQVFLTSWGYKEELPKDYNEIKLLGDKAAMALQRVHGTQYQVGTATSIFGPGSGGSDDWAKGSGNFKYSYTLELRDKGRYGFLLPEAQIQSTGEETFEAFKVFANSLIPSKK